MGRASAGRCPGAATTQIWFGLGASDPLIRRSKSKHPGSAIALWRTETRWPVLYDDNFAPIGSTQTYLASTQAIPWNYDNPPLLLQCGIGKKDSSPASDPNTRSKSQAIITEGAKLRCSDEAYTSTVTHLLTHHHRPTGQNPVPRTNPKPEGRRICKMNHRTRFRPTVRKKPGCTPSSHPLQGWGASGGTPTTRALRNRSPNLLPSPRPNPDRLRNIMDHRYVNPCQIHRDK